MWHPCAQSPQTDKIEHGFHLRRALFAARQTKGHVFGHAEVGEDGVILENHAHAPFFGRELDTAVSHLLPLNQNHARVGLLKPGDQAQRGGFPAAAWSQQGQNLPGRHAKRHVIHDGLVAKRFTQIAANDRCGFHKKKSERKSLCACGANHFICHAASGLPEAQTIAAAAARWAQRRAQKTLRRCCSRFAPPGWKIPAD